MFSYRKLKSCLVIFSVLALFSFSYIQPVPGAEEPPSPEEQALKLQNLYGKMTSLVFDFEQVTRTGGRERTGRGNAVFYKTHSPSPAARPGNGIASRSVMRWNYTEPDNQIIINDGTTLLIYTENDHQMIKTPAREIESDITYAFFAGTRNLMDDFAARAAGKEFIYSSADKLNTILLVPRKPHNQIKDVQIWFDEKGIIHHMLIADHFNSITELNFDHIKLNSLPPGDQKEIDRITSFTVPPGTEIITP